MKDQGKTKGQLINELAKLRQRIAELEAAEPEGEQVEEALRESEERYRNIVELAPDGIATVSLKGVVTSCNSAFLELTGFSRDEIVGTHVSKFPTLRIEDIPRYTKIIFSALRGKTFRPFEFIWVHKDGTTRWGEAHMSLMKKGSRIMGLQVILRDVTERKQTEERLRDSEEKLSSIVVHAGVGILVLQDGQQRFYNAKLYEMMGYAKAEYEKLDYLSLIHPEDRPLAVGRIRQRLAGTATDSGLAQMRILAKSGEFRWVEASSVRIEWEGRPAIQAFVLDITDRKRAEEALRESEERDRDIAASIPGAVYQFLLRPDGTFAVPYMSESGEDLFERPLAELTDPSLLYDGIHPDDRAPFRQSVADAAQRMEQWTHEFRIAKPGDWVKWLRGSANPRRLPDGSILWNGVLLDITERKQAEGRLRRERDLNQTLIQASPAFFVAIDADGKTMMMNDAMLSSLGYSGDEVIGSDYLTTFVPEKDRGTLSEIFEELARSGKPSVNENRVLTRDGRERLVEWHGRSIWDETGNLDYVFGLGVDISKRKQAQERLRESEEKFRQMAENSRDFFWMRDLKSGDLIYLTSTFERLWDRSIEDQYEQPMSWLENIHPEDRDRMTAVLEKQSRGEPTEIEYRVVWSDGSIHWLRDRVTPIRDEVGEAYRLSGVVEDITERRQAEEALRESERKWHAIFDHHYQLTGLIDTEGRLLAANRTALRFAGVEESEVIGQHFWDGPWWVPSQRRKVQDAVESAVKGEFVRFETTHPTPDGGSRNIDFSLNPVRDDGGNVIYVVPEGRDITEIRQAEEALRENEARLRSLSDNLPGGMTYQLDMGKDGQIRQFTYVSAGVEKMHEITAEAVLQDAGLLYGQIIEADRTLIAEQEAQAQATMTPFVAEARFQLPSGVVRWRLLTSAPRRAPNGHLIWDGIELDITERKRAEERLRESEARLSSFMNSASDSFYLLDSDLNFVEINEKGLEIIGRSREDVIGKNIADIVPDVKESGRYEQHLEVIRTGQPFTIDDHVPHPVFGDLHFVLKSFKVGSGLGVIASDISERVRAEEEQERLLAQIQEQAQRMQQIVDTVPEGVLLLDADGRIISANPTAERDLTVLSEATVGEILIRLGDRPLAELLTSPPKGLWHEVAVDGRIFQTIARPIETGPTPTGWVLVIRDVTQQREIQQRAQEQERLAAVGQLAAGIAHDFNNIMAVIVLYAELTTRVEGLPTLVQERMDTIGQQARHATNLIQQILDFSRRAVLERQPLELAMLLKEHVKLLGRTLPESIEIALDCEPDMYMVNADPTRMQQMVTNLALNARDAMPDGGELDIGLERIEVRPEESPPLPEMEAGEWVRITVSDTGVGIPPDVLPHIFDPFFSTKERGKGTGLGLAQVYGIVGAHEGRIDVDTQVGKGTTFTIYLPMYSSEPSPLSSHAELPTLPEGKGETILIVEDDDIVRKALADSLELLNYQVLQVSHGQEALEMLEQRREEIALVLSDVVMPQMGGIALLHVLRERGLTVPVVMVTGHPMQREMEDLRAHGMIDWLPKPPHLDQLAKVVARVLGRD